MIWDELVNGLILLNVVFLRLGVSCNALIDITLVTCIVTIVICTHKQIALFIVRHVNDICVSRKHSPV